MDDNGWRGMIQSSSPTMIPTGTIQSWWVMYDCGHVDQCTEPYAYYAKCPKCRYQTGAARRG